MVTRHPNTGPYIITYCSPSGIMHQEEAHRWYDCCFRLRRLLIENNTKVSVRFV